MSATPTPTEIRVYLDAMEKLSDFEVSHRHTRGWGAFDPASLPIPEAVTVKAWLETMAAPAGDVTPVGTP